MRTTLAGAAALAAMLLSGCALMISGYRYRIPVDSNVPQAKVEIYKNGSLVASGITPETFILSAKGGYGSPAKYTFRFTKEGCQTAEETIEATFNRWYLGNAIFLGYSVIGFAVVDPLTGAMWKFKKGTAVHGTLKMKTGVEGISEDGGDTCAGPHSGRELAMPFFPMMFVPRR